MRNLLLTIVVGLLAAAGLSSAGGARVTAWPTCPTDPKASPTTLWVRNYPPGSLARARGSTWCKDGGTATVKLVGYLPSGKPTGYTWSVTVTGGLCTNTKNGRYIQFGTRITLPQKRRATDPAGIFVNDPTKASGLDDWGDFGKGASNWAEDLTIKWTSPKTGTFKGEAGQWIGDTYTLVRAAGSFTCRRLVPVTWG